MRADGALSRQSWIDQARRNLVEHGVEDVKVDRLARAIGVSRGSFYWHFADVSDLRLALVEDWEARNYFAIAQWRARLATMSDTPIEALCTALEQTASLPPFELAMRLWARSCKAANAAAARVDAAWLALLVETAGETTGRRRWACGFYLHQIGRHAVGARFAEQGDGR